MRVNNSLWQKKMVKQLLTDNKKQFEYRRNINTRFKYKYLNVKKQIKWINY